MSCIKLLRMVNGEEILASVRERFGASTLSPKTVVGYFIDPLKSFRIVQPKIGQFAFVPVLPYAKEGEVYIDGINVLFAVGVCEEMEKQFLSMTSGIDVVPAMPALKLAE